MQAALKQAWVPAKTARPMRRPLPGRLAVPLIGTICAALWVGLFALWHAIA